MTTFWFGLIFFLNIGQKYLLVVGHVFGTAIKTHVYVPFDEVKSLCTCTLLCKKNVVTIVKCGTNHASKC